MLFFIMQSYDCRPLAHSAGVDVKLWRTLSWMAQWPPNGSHRGEFQPLAPCSTSASKGNKVTVVYKFLQSYYKTMAFQNISWQIAIIFEKLAFYNHLCKPWLGKNVKNLAGFCFFCNFAVLTCVKHETIEHTAADSGGAGHCRS